MSQKQILTSPDGLKWYVGGAETDDHLALGGHEPALEPIMRSMLDPNKAFVNIGAHVGLWAVRMASSCEYVYAFEANPLTAESLRQNIALNELSNVEVINAALWDKDGEIVEMVDVNGKSTGGSTRAQAVENYAVDSIRVNTITLDRCWPFDQEVGLIVMDVEGAEARVLRGALQTILHDRPNMIIELHEGHPGTDANLRSQVYNLLKECRYDFKSVDITGERLLCYPAELQLDENQPVR